MNTECEWCEAPTDDARARLCRRCRIIEAEENYIWGQAEGYRRTPGAGAA